MWKQRLWDQLTVMRHDTGSGRSIMRDEGKERCASSANNAFSVVEVCEYVSMCASVSARGRRHTSLLKERLRQRLVGPLALHHPSVHNLSVFVCFSQTSVLSASALCLLYLSGSAWSYLVPLRHWCEILPALDLKSLHPDRVKVKLLACLRAPF